MQTTRSTAPSLALDFGFAAVPVGIPCRKDGVPGIPPTLVYKGEGKAWVRGIVLGLCLASPLAHAEEGSPPSLHWQALLDLRMIHSDGPTSFEQGGLGKGRYGGDSNLLRASEASLVLLPRFSWSWSGNLSLKYSGEQHHPIDIMEGFLSYRPVSTSPWNFSAKIGSFFPPVSLENHGIAWSSPYTLSSSAINAWIGEEVKINGGEGSISYTTDDRDKISLIGAVFTANDPAGSLLAWRGWGLHDYKSTLFDRAPLPQISDISTTFPRQAAWNKPVTSVDNHPGFYTGLTWDSPELIKFKIIYYDNQADPTKVSDGQYGWRTRFISPGVRINLPYDAVFISQGMSGSTAMGADVLGRPAITDDFWSYFFLLSKTYDIHRVSVRFDRFGVKGHGFVLRSYNNELGHALTFSYSAKLTDHQQLSLEFIRIVSTREPREDLGVNPDATDNVGQLSYRLFFR